MTIEQFPQLVQMRMGVSYRMPVRIRNFSVMLRPLSLAEQVQVASETASDFSALPKDMKHNLSEHTLLAKNTLVKASTPDVDTASPSLTGELITRMTAEEVVALFKEYTTIVDKCNPLLEVTPLEDLQGLVNEVKKNPSIATEQSFSDLVKIVRFLATPND